MEKHNSAVDLEKIAADHAAPKPAGRLNAKTRKVMEESVKLSDFTHRLFWLTMVLSVFALVQMVILFLKFYGRS